ncbi:MAG: hypothetical protein JXP34_21690 [Planctomycetes bacterium]|nr:hypothetical protein [Planctomycetota bacterium]
MNARAFCRAVAILPALAAIAAAAAPSYDRAFFPGASYDEAIPMPETILRYRIGDRPTTPDRIEACLKAWAGATRRARIVEYARSHEGRPLHYIVISSEANMTRVEEILHTIDSLGDPRRVADPDADRIIESTPAIAWLASGIHGDELSGPEAMLAVAYHLVAGRDADVTRIRDEIVVIIDPAMNPDGRARFIHQIEEAAGRVPNLDAQSLQHTGSWPYGRGNHYLFDLNRDWLVGAHPETRGRMAAILDWNPQIVVDAHEMGPFQTFLFPPPREPIHPGVSEAQRELWERFAADQARALDRFGWSYYTREWFEYWFPGYTEAWSSFLGAIGILYEQAGVDGGPLRRPDGTVLTYAESIHHHIASAMANLETLRANRKEILRAFRGYRRAAVEGTRAGDRRTFLLAPGRSPSRDRAFLDLLARHGIEVSIAREAFAATDVVSAGGAAEAERRFPAGTAIVSVEQPRGPLALALLEFDPRMSDDFLAEERREIERRKGSKIYDTTAWCAAMLYDVDAYWSKHRLAVPSDPYESGSAPRGGLPKTGTYGYVIDGSGDESLRALAVLFEDGIAVRVAEKDFAIAGRPFRRGSLLIRVHENGPDLAARIRAAAEATGVEPAAVDTARAGGAGPDLGGGHFPLLARPRIAVLCQDPISTSAYGFVWNALDAEAGVRMSSIPVARLGGVDLRLYNVLVIPDAKGAGTLRRALEPDADPLRAWIQSGGTLIAMGSAAAAIADAGLRLSDVRLRRDVLEDLAAYEPDPPRGIDEPGKEGGEERRREPSAEDRARIDEWRRLFSPEGTILRAEADLEHWLTLGCAADVPVFAQGSHVLLARHPVAVPLRFAASERLRLSGLLWPEAAARIAGSAYATVERRGRGQVILFADHPAYRAYWRTTTRVLLNAILLGPGAGASQPTPW